MSSITILKRPYKYNFPSEVLDVLVGLRVSLTSLPYLKIFGKDEADGVIKSVEATFPGYTHDTHYFVSVGGLVQACLEACHTDAEDWLLANYNTTDVLALPQEICEYHP
jgi:hypothetical protein